MYWIMKMAERRAHAFVKAGGKEALCGVQRDLKDPGWDRALDGEKRCTTCVRIEKRITPVVRPN